METPLHVIFGAGQVGYPLAERLISQGLRVRVAKRSRTEVPSGTDIVLGDAADASFCAAFLKQGDHVRYRTENGATRSYCRPRTHWRPTMFRILRFLAMLFAITGLAAIDGSALAQPKGKDKDRKEQGEAKGKGQEESDAKGKGKEQKAKQHKHQNGKDLVGDKIKQNGKHAFHQNGKHTAYVDVKGGKIAGVTVTHADKGNVPVKKYKSTKKMAAAPAGDMQPVSFTLAQAYSLGTVWIGYSYIDDYGDEVIYWFPYEMILDGDTGAVDYVPIY